MSKSIIKLALVSTLSIGLSGCVIVAKDGNWSDDNWRATQKENRKAIANLELDTARSQVMAELGSPDFSEAFTRDGDNYQVLYYRTQHRHSNNETTKDETTPLIFKNDKLVGWGEESLRLVR